MTIIERTVKMGYAIFIICVILYGQTTTPAWKWQNPLPQGNQLRQIFFLDSINGFVADIEAGTILKTTDGGGTWIIKWTYPNESPGYYGLNGIYFANSDTGYAVGYWLGNSLTNSPTGIILRSTDRGNNWQIISKGVYPDIGGVCFPTNGTTGYCVGRNGTILKTTNAGISWTTQSSGNNSILYYVDFPVNEQTGYVATGLGGPSVIAKTTNGGLNWNTVLSCQGYFWGIKFVNNNIGYAAGHVYVNNQWVNVIKTTDGGNSWQIVFSKNFGETYGIDFIDSLTGYIAAYWGDVGWGDSTGILKTTDGGATWNMKLKVSRIRTNFFRWICFPTSRIGFATGAFDDQNGKHGQILKTTDYGETWQYLTSYDVDTICDVEFPLGQETIGFAATSAGNVLKTTDSGNSWIQQNTGITSPLYAIHFRDLSNGYACGANGVVIKTTNGGTTWNPVNTGSTAALYDIYFSTPQIGYTGGWRDFFTNAVLLRTTDGGNTWNQQTVPNNQSGRAVRRFMFPVSPDTGFFVTGPPREYDSYSNGAVCKTTNGGLSWQEIYAPSPARFYDLQFINNQVGYVAGNIGQYKVAKTTNGGSTWSTQFQPGDIIPATCISFPTDQVGYLGFPSGGNHTFAKTTNGGATWFPVNTITKHIYEELYFVNESIGFTVGRGGMIQKTTNGGQVWIEEKGDKCQNMYDHNQRIWAYPNPFRYHCVIKFQIPNSNDQTNSNSQIPNNSAISLKIYDVSGRVVKSFNFESCIMYRESSVVWYGDDNSGRELPAGVYFIVPDDRCSSPVRVVKIR